MNQRALQLLDEILNLVEHMRRETEESKRYYQNGDIDSAVRNTNASRDEMDTLARKWRELEAEIRQ